MKRPDQACDFGKGLVGRDEIEVVGIDDVPRDERQNLAPLLVEPEHTRRALEPGGLEVAEQRMDAGRPGPGRAPHGVSDANDLGVGVAALQELFVHRGRS